MLSVFLLSSFVFWPFDSQWWRLSNCLNEHFRGNAKGPGKKIQMEEAKTWKTNGCEVNEKEGRRFAKRKSCWWNFDEDCFEKNRGGDWEGAVDGTAAGNFERTAAEAVRRKRRKQKKNEKRKWKNRNVFEFLQQLRPFFIIHDDCWMYGWMAA